MQNWGIDMRDPQKQWRQCDADGFGKVLFDEFCNWAILKSLDLDDDDDVTDSDIEVNQISREAQNKQNLKNYTRDQLRKEMGPKKTYDTSIWAELKAKLPWKKTSDDLARRVD